MSQVKTQVVSVFLSFRAATGASVDAVLTSPALRSQFLQRVREEVGEIGEEAALKCIINARKKSIIVRV